jgi:predicted Mrr-cat superfamily restriction endonuclease
LKRLLGILILILLFTGRGFSQEQEVKTQKTVTTTSAQDPKKVTTSDPVKSVPVTDKNLEAIRLQNRKVTMEQMHTINKAIRKSMTIHKRR